MWVPILSGENAATAQAIVADVATRLVQNDPSSVPLDQLCGHALLFAYMAKRDRSNEWSTAAENWLNAAVERVAEAAPTNVGLFGGIAGLGWTLEHVMRMFQESEDAGDDGDASEDDPLEEIDALLFRSLTVSGERYPYDLVSGFVGLGVYWLERLPRQTAHDGLRLILDRLEAKADSSWGGKTWKTPPEELPPTQLESFPRGYYNLGVAHGVPGVLYLLSEMAEAGVERKRAAALGQSASEWLLMRRRPPDAGTRFTHWFMPGAEPTDSRLGWCYGDLGIAAVLHGIARGGADPDPDGKHLTLQFLSKEMYDRCLTWPCDRDDMVDMGLCHGAFGVAHIYNRLFQRLGDTTYRAGAVRWFEHGLSMRRAEYGVAGLFSWNDTEQPAYLDDHSFLGGATGCALALLAASSDVAPDWDRCLLLSSRHSTMKGGEPA